MKIIPLDGSIHDRRNFDCGDLSLNKFLQEQAQQKAKRFGSKTVVLVHDDDPTTILGYHTTLIAHVETTAMPEGRLGKDPIPMLFLARFAVDQRFQGKGFGRILLIDVLKKAKVIAEATALFGVVLDAILVAIDDEAERFYLKFEFKALTDRPRHLYLPIGTILQLLDNG